MTRAFWDSQFKFSELLPDFSQCLETMKQKSADFARGREFERISYGSDTRQWVEITQGTGSARIVPVVIHGGYWRALEAERHRGMMAGLLDQGTSVANIEYRLMPEVRMSDLVADVVAGLGALAKRLPDYQFVLVGHSAGAHLALAAAPDVKRIRGVVAVSGIYELWPIAQCFLQDELNLTSDEIETYSLSPHTSRTPVLYLTGEAETHEFHRQSARMAQGSKTAWQQLPKVHHMATPLAATAPESARLAFETLAGLQLGT